MMLKSLKPMAVAAVLSMMAPIAHAQSADTVMANVNGVEITLGHMIMVRQGLPEQYQTLPDDVLWKGILDQLVQQSVLAQAGREERSNRVQVALENEERALRAAEAVEGIVISATSDEAVLEAYEAEFAKGGGTEYNASHILVESREQAAEISIQARNGAEFAGLAREFSTGPSGPNGGELGWFGDGMMVPEFEGAVKQLRVGGVSDPVQTQFGWHVIRLNDSRLKEAPPLEEVRAQIEQRIQSEAVEARLAELMGKAEIKRTEANEVNPAILREVDLLDK